jgi:hypothetical protein
MRLYSFRINSPKVMVISDVSVVRSKIFAANLLFEPIASAMMKLAIAVGHAKRINKIPRS